MGRTERKIASLAEKADRHALYQRAVQCPEADINFIDETYQSLHGAYPSRLREDFCGSAAVCCEWVQRRRGNCAVGIDIDPEVLAWGRNNNLSRLDNAEAARVRLVECDVLTVETEPFQVISAMNFSYWLMTERDLLKRYFRRVYQALTDDGIFFLDAYGGYDSFRNIIEEREIDEEAPDGFTYIWEQERYEPISGRLTSHIHFTFRDGSRLDRAFSYHWRLWTLPEIQDLLQEAGFRQITVYWQGWDNDGEPDGIFVPTQEADADAGWICYICAGK